MYCNVSQAECFVMEEYIRREVRLVTSLQFLGLKFMANSS